MSLTPGTRIGHYEILGSLGAGGMGEVYRARDTRLDRDVAIKVLPSHLSADPDALARFEREAKAVAALSHPNILAIHDFGRVDGVAFAVTELLEGETLREWLASGPLPPKKVLQIASDIAIGLAAAHEKSVVHRDVKPENVFVTADGRVKILDFGLARQVAGHAGPFHAASAGSDAATALVTEPGLVMGTVGYMAPEQVKGQPADQRSDIFALGCLLYEMASGRKAFSRETAAETMTAILREEPEDLPADPGRLSPAFAEIVRHCLEKRPDERFQSARDLAFALQAVGGPATTSGRTAVRPGDVGRTRRWRTAAAAAAVAVVAFAIGRFTTGTPERPVSVLAFEQVTDAPGVETMPTISPDGQTVVYVVTSGRESDIYSLRSGSRTARLLTRDSPGQDQAPAFSPDGSRIAFRSSREGGGIFLMNADGDSVRRLSSTGFDPAWSPDGRRLVVANGTFDYPTDRGMRNMGLSIIDVDTGGVQTLSATLDALQPVWSPGGERIAFWGLRGQSGQRDLWTIAADGSDLETNGRAVTDDAALDWSPTWSPDGRYLYFSSNRGGTMNLWRAPIDQASGDVLGDPEPVTTPSLWSGRLGITRDGTALVYASLDWRSTLYRVPFDPARGELGGPPVVLRRSTRPIRDHELSPDGEWLALNETGAQEDLLLVRTDGREYRRLTDDPARDRSPVWSPDGQRIAFYSDRGGTYQVWTVRPDGSDFVQLTDLPQAPNFPTWSPDGARLAISFVGDDAKITETARTRAETAEPLAPIPDAWFWPLSWSPDSSRLAGLLLPKTNNRFSGAIYDFRTGQYEPLPALEATFLIPAWIDNERLLVRDDSGISIHRPGEARKLLLPVGGYFVGRSLGLSHDRRWITYTETGSEGDIWLARLSAAR